MYSLYEYKNQNNPSSGRPHPSAPSPPSSSGAVLLMVLGFLAILSLLVVKASQTAFRHLEERYLTARAGVADDDIHFQLFSATEAAIAALQVFRSTNDGLFNPTAEGWAQPLETLNLSLGQSIRVTVSDYSHRIPLLLLDRDTLRAALVEFDLSRSEAAELADTLLDWIDPDDIALPRGGEALAYRNLRIFGNLRVRPPNREVRDFQSLSLIPIYREIFFAPTAEAAQRLQFFRDHFTLDSLPININAASPDTLKLIESFSDVSFPVSMRSSPQPGDRQWRPVLRERLRGEVPSWIATASQSVLIRAEIERGDRTFYREAVLRTRGAAVENPVPLQVRSGILRSTSAVSQIP